MILLADEAELVRLCEAEMSGPLAVLFGGWSSEREVSLMSGQAVLTALKASGLPVLAIDVERDIAEVLREKKIRHVFNALHGPFGEDGVMEGLLQLLNISSSSSGVLASALAMDKVRSKQLWQGIGLQTPAFQVVDADSDPQQVLQYLGGKAMVKPCREGSSIGMSIATTAEEMSAAIELALGYDKSVLAERFIVGPEFSVPVVSDQVLPIVELKPAGQFYDYEAKYLSSETQYQCPAELSPEHQKTASELASLAYRSLGCSGWGRVDLLQDSAGEFYVLEVNTIPGMTEHSIVPMSAKAHGISFTALVLNVLLESLSTVTGHSYA